MTDERALNHDRASVVYPALVTGILLFTRDVYVRATLYTPKATQRHDLKSDKSTSSWEEDDNFRQVNWSYFFVLKGRGFIFIWFFSVLPKQHYLAIQIFIIVSCRGTAFFSTTLQEFGESF